MAPILAAYPDAVNDGWRPTPLNGVMRRTVPIHEDGRGSFAELWRNSWTETLSDRPFVQGNLSRSAAGVLRGLHFHQRQTDLWIVLEGQAHVTLVDIRARLADASASTIAFSEAVGPGDAILIPEGVAHGFWALDPLVLLYLVTNEYDGSDELGFAWNDPEVAATWPPGEPIVSARDSHAPRLTEALAQARK